MESLGIDYANCRLRPLSVAHLYNAVRQVRSCKKQWPAMEDMIRIQTPAHLFIGDLPTVPESFTKRYGLVFGTLIKSYARDQRRNQPINRCRVRRYLEKRGELVQVFRERFSTAHGHDDCSLETLEAMLCARFKAVRGTDITELDGGEASDSEKTISIVLRDADSREKVLKAQKRGQKTDALRPVEFLLASRNALEPEI